MLVIAGLNLQESLKNIAQLFNELPLEQSPRGIRPHTGRINETTLRSLLIKLQIASPIANHHTMNAITQLQRMGSNVDCPVVVLTNNKEDVLMGLRHYASDKGKTVSVWTIPGGRSDGNESLKATLRREIAEEVGIINFEITDFLGTVPGAKEGDVVHAFLGNTTEEAKLMEPEKFSKWKWVNVHELPPNFSEQFINPAVLALITGHFKK